MADDQAAAAAPSAVAAPGAPWWGGADFPLRDQISQPRLRDMGEEILDFKSQRIDPPFGAKIFLKSSEVFSISALGLDRPTGVHIPLAVNAATRRPFLAMVATTRTNPTLVLLTGLDETAPEEQPTCAWRFAPTTPSSPFFLSLASCPTDAKVLSTCFRRSHATMCC